MKLRIDTNSVCLRLSPGDVERFADSGTIEETLHFPDGRRLRYGLRIADDLDQLWTAFEEEILEILLPASWVREWVESDRTGFEGSTSAPNGQALRIAVEKDLPCRHSRADKEDGFPKVAASPTSAVDETAAGRR